MKKIFLAITAIAILAGCQNANSNKSESEAKKINNAISKERIYLYEGIDHVGEIIPALDEEHGAFVNEYDKDGRLVVRSMYTIDEGESELDGKLIITYDKDEIVRIESIMVWGYDDNDTIVNFMEDGKWKARNIKGEIIDLPEDYKPQINNTISVDKQGKCVMDGMAEGKVTKYDENGRWTEATLTGTIEGTEELILIAKREILATHP